MNLTKRWESVTATAIKLGFIVDGVVVNESALNELFKLYDSNN